MGLKDFLIFMLFFVAGAAVIAAVVYLIIRILGRVRSAAQTDEYTRFNRELDERLEKRGFTRTLIVSDNFAVDENTGSFFCSFPFGGAVEEAVLPLSAITEYRLEPAAAFTVGYLFTYAFTDSYPPRKVSRQVHVMNDEVEQRLRAALIKYEAGKPAGAESEPEDKGGE